MKKGEGTRVRDNKRPCCKGSHPWRIYAPGMLKYVRKVTPAPSNMRGPIIKALRGE